MTSLAYEAALASPPPASDVIALCAADHDEIAVLFAALEELARDPARGADARSLARTLAEAVALHARAEERVVYGACVECGVPTLAELAHDGWRAHDALGKALRTVVELAPGPDGKLAAALRTARTIFERHREDEEDELFLALDLAFGPDQRAAMGRAVVMEKERLRADHVRDAAKARRHRAVR